METFSEWRRGLIKEDENLGLKDVIRPQPELHKMYRRYREYEQAKLARQNKAS